LEHLAYALALPNHSRGLSLDYMNFGSIPKYTLTPAESSPQAQSCPAGSWEISDLGSRWLWRVGGGFRQDGQRDCGGEQLK